MVRSFTPGSNAELDHSGEAGRMLPIAASSSTVRRAVRLLGSRIVTRFGSNLSLCATIIQPNAKVPISRSTPI